MPPVRHLLPISALLLAAACDFDFGPEADRCAASAPVGQMALVLEPRGPSPFDFEWLAPGDTSYLDAWVAPITGAVTDIWGGGGCKYVYGAAITTTLEWRSANPGIATIDSEGRVVARSPGQTTVTVRAPVHQLEKSREVRVAVTGQYP